MKRVWDFLNVNTELDVFVREAENAVV